MSHLQPSTLESPPPLDAPPAYDRLLMFYLNGEKVVIHNADPTLLLVDYLRLPHVGLTGTRKACGQGGAGRAR